MIHSVLTVQYMCLTVSFHNLSLQVFFGLPLGLATPLHTPYTSSPNHCILFATHAQTIATYFAVVPRLCHLILVSLSLNSLLETLSFTLTSHIHLTILISAHWSTTSFSSVTGQVSTYYFAYNSCTVSSHYRWYIHIGKQWYQLPEFIPSNSNSVPQMHQHLHPHSTCHSKTYLLSPNLHWHQ